MMEFTLVFGGLLGAYAILRLTKSSDANRPDSVEPTSPCNIERASMDLTQLGDPDHIERYLSGMDLECLEALARQMAVTVRDDIPDDQLRTYLVLSVYRRLVSPGG